MGAEPNRRLVLDSLVTTWTKRDRDNPQGSGVDAGVAASALAEALAALDAALIERDAEIRRAEHEATDAAGERDELVAALAATEVRIVRVTCVLNTDAVRAAVTLREALRLTHGGAVALYMAMLGRVLDVTEEQIVDAIRSARKVTR